MLRGMLSSGGMWGVISRVMHGVGIALGENGGGHGLPSPEGHLEAPLFAYMDQVHRIAWCSKSR